MTEINDFVKEANIIVHGLTFNTDYENKEKYFKYIWRGEQFLALPHSITASYYKALLILQKKASVTARAVSNRSLESAFEDFLFELYYTQNKDNPLANIHKRVGDLFRTIRHLDMFEYLVIVPIVNIKVEACLEIGSVEIKELTPTKIGEMNEKYGVDLGMQRNENEEDIVKRIQGDSRHPTVSITMVQSSDHDKAEELGIQATDQALNVLRFYLPSFRGMIKGEELTEVKRTIMIANITKKLPPSEKEELCNPVDPLDSDEIIDHNAILTLRRHQLGVVHQLLNKPVTELSPLQRDILNAIYWIGNAAKDVINTNRNITLTDIYRLLLLVQSISISFSIDISLSSANTCCDVATGVNTAAVVADLGHVHYLILLVIFLPKKLLSSFTTRSGCSS